MRSAAAIRRRPSSSRRRPIRRRPRSTTTTRRSTAPFDGIVTARLVSVGELVGGSTADRSSPPSSSTSPIYVNFTISEQDVLRVRAEIARRGISVRGPQEDSGRGRAADRDRLSARGTLDYASPAVSQSTGTLAVRAILQNADRVLLPGYFVRVRVPLGQQQDALLVPESALGSDQGGRYVLVVNKDNVVEQRKVEIGPTVGELRVIESGLDRRTIASSSPACCAPSRARRSIRRLQAAAAAARRAEVGRP